MAKLELGAELRDRIIGFVGVVTSRTEYLTNCDRYGLQPKVDKDGKIPQVEFFDDLTLERTKSRNDFRPEVVKLEKTGGPMPAPQASPNPR